MPLSSLATAFSGSFHYCLSGLSSVRRELTASRQLACKNNHFLVKLLHISMNWENNHEQ
jgi:hypothetical protein